MWLDIGMFIGLCVMLVIIYQQYWMIVHLDIKLTHEKNRNAGYQQMIERIEQEQAEALFKERETLPHPQKEPSASVFDSDPHPGNPAYPG